MMQRIPFGTPVNQNIIASPTKKRKNDPLSEILIFLKSAGLALPAHIARLVSENGDISAKHVQNNNREDEGKKLRVELSECEFQLKKLEEDFAEYKRQVKIQKDKEFKRNEELISKLRTTIEENSEDSTHKYEKLLQEHEEEKRSLKLKHQLQLEQEVTKIKESLQAKIKSEERLRKRDISELQRSHEQKLNELIKNHEEVVQALQKRSEDELLQLKLKHRSIIEDKERRHESIRVALQSQRKTEEKLHEKTKLETSKEKQKLIGQLCFQSNTRRQLELDIQSKQAEIKRLKSVINDMEVSLHLLSQKSQKKAKQMKQEYDLKWNQEIQVHKTAINSLKLTHYEELSQIEGRLAKMEEVHQQKIELLSQNSEELAQNFDHRPSKREDIEEIDKLKWALAKKDEQARKLLRDLKHCNLQLENKQDIYTRIFRGNSRQRRNTPRQERQQMFIDQKLGKEGGFRKSQTSQTKYLMKIYSTPKNV